ncbi:3-carboxy-cis,cis-muconate cycloisomerase [Tropicimonas sp. IMCC6043]|uniref:3-carboxy-cis,cis-muconate cycloisomerase n=1 Tax=Tropicimonas sp. IMCC6043 TaxID=2510645 RepID=UPI00101D9245|nr:3-carboxy-cis,cis-muconate cycloisomerase [Tropicimonas sp. IMCC6043]RYH12214.1 3-carboxy-cis,cis-muconate cycloisomerase [Tropicimonas sp. IMCC6043]
MTPLAYPGHIFAPLFSDPEIEALWSRDRFLAEFLNFEIALAGALAEAGVVPPATAETAVARMATFVADPERIAASVPVDGVPVPDFVRQLKAHVGDEGLPAVHRGATSQDLVDTAIVRILRDANALLDARLGALDEGFTSLDARFGDAPMMGRTRMQAALPIRVSDRLAGWRLSLAEERAGLGALRTRIEILQFGGPVGNRAALAPHGDAVADALARRLDLGNPPRAWHAARGSLAEYAGWLSRVTATLGKFGQDIGMMAQQGVNEVAIAGGGGSSAMPHKQNPVRAELLVTLARHNAVLLPGMHQAMLHEQERSGAAWTLEWMILPAMVMTTGRALLTAAELQGQITRLGAV